ncbi:MAG: N-formylglutamate amidohydrolase, partial [Pseudomonadota bacterium]
MTPLLRPGDPAPAVTVPGASGWLLTVEHAGRAIPTRLSSLGLPDDEIDRHIGWDPGALALAEALRTRLDATLAAQPYSRLVIDCNRPRGAPDLVPETSDGTRVPRNLGLERWDVDARWDAIHAPFHAAVAAALPRAKALLSIHTYAPQRQLDAAERPWPIGLLWRRANPLAEGLARRLAPYVEPLGLNRPYEIEDESDYTIPVHAEPCGLPHVLIEVRNDRLGSPESIAHKADLLAAA